MELMPPSLALKRSFVGASTFGNTAQNDSANEAASCAYHAFRIGDIGLLIPQEIISEVAEEVAYCPLPNTRAVLFGMANLRGNIIPLFDLHELFGFVTPGNATRKFLIIGRGEDAVAVMISGLPQRIIVTNDHRLRNLPPMPESLQPYLKSCYQKEGVWLDIDYPGFFDSLGDSLL